MHVQRLSYILNIFVSSAIIIMTAMKAEQSIQLHKNKCQVHIAIINKITPVEN